MKKSNAFLSSVMSAAILLFLVSGTAFAEAPTDAQPESQKDDPLFIYCESGDPGGGGPTVDMAKVIKTSRYEITVDYNRRNLDSSAPSSTFEFHGAPTKVESVQVDRENCTRSTFQPKRGKKSLQYDACETFSRMTLVDFTPKNPDYSLYCQ